MAAVVYGNYEQSALDAQYDMRAAIPAFADFVVRWNEWSAEARRALPCTLDVVYGASDAEKLDIFHAPGDAPGPVQIFFHGGYWRAMDKSAYDYVARAFSPRGAVTIVPNYALCPTVDIDEIVRQCRAAIAWAWRNVARYGGDPARIHISGHSAGGHIVAMALKTDWEAFGVEADSPVAGVTAISGLYDLAPLRLSFLNEDLRMTLEQAARNSPLELGMPAAATPMILTVGADESDEFRRQTQTYVEAWRSAGHLCQHLEAEGRHHYTVLDAFEDASHPLGAAVLAQMGIGPG